MVWWGSRGDFTLYTLVVFWSLWCVQENGGCLLLNVERPLLGSALKMVFREAIMTPTLLEYKSSWCERSVPKSA
jgi:hypothetical protein